MTSSTVFKRISPNIPFILDISGCQDGMGWTIIVQPKSVNNFTPPGVNHPSEFSKYATISARVYFCSWRHKGNQQQPFLVPKDGDHNFTNIPSFAFWLRRSWLTPFEWLFFYYEVQRRFPAYSFLGTFSIPRALTTSDRSIFRSKSCELFCWESQESERQRSCFSGNGKSNPSILFTKIFQQPRLKLTLFHSALHRKFPNNFHWTLYTIYGHVE